MASDTGRTHPVQRNMSRSPSPRVSREAACLFHVAEPPSPKYSPRVLRAVLVRSRPTAVMLAAPGLLEMVPTLTSPTTAAPR
ncbi:hypothetical protein CERSUDRAFT_101584 [Gelatoporia subvermispora B]|uniref:Uncharacterized protein n=1 Tax=Ceriporiopsis subvermispora (strain B) TaxID=914234 RepID=M2QUW0_CERS8|nr:hypothetical protein CERSUDRAFT_101584 [Gelatoporia subvermispora B]